MLKNKSVDKVFLLKHFLLKENDPDREGPYDIVDVHENGAVDICRGVIAQPMNARRLAPHF